MESMLNYYGYSAIGTGLTGTSANSELWRYEEMRRQYTAMQENQMNNKPQNVATPNKPNQKLLLLEDV